MKLNQSKLLIAAEVTLPALTAEEVEAKGPAKFDVQAYNGGALELAGFDLPVVTDLSGLKRSKNLVANLDHDSQKRVGHVTAIDNDKKTLKLSGVFSAATTFRAEVVESAQQGFTWEASIEATIHKLVKVAPGKTVEVNGQQFTGPVYVVRQSSLSGFAFVNHGADADTSVKIAASADSSAKGKAMTPELKAWAESKGFNCDDMTDDQVAVIEAAYAGQQPVKPTNRTLDEIISAEEAEEERQRQILDLTAEALAKTENTDRGEGFLMKLKLVAEKAIAEKQTARDFELTLLRASRPQVPSIFRSRDTDRRVDAKTVEAAICMTGGLPNIEKRFDEKVLNVAADRYPRGMSLNQLYAVAAQANGYRGNPWETESLELHRAAFNLGRNPGELRASGGFSTFDLSGILSNIANKFLLEGWLGQDMTWQRISKISSVNDFKTQTSYRLSGNLKYEKVGSDGQLKHGTVSEDTYTVKADTYGIMFGITRTDRINDDLGALTDVPREMGMGANDSFNDVFWTEFLNNGAFFVAGNNNVSTGALDTAALKAAEVVLLDQTKPNGTPLGLMGAILLVPTGLKRTARELMNSSLMITGTNTTLPNVNTFENEYRVETSPYMGNAAFTGNSDVAWYLLVDPVRLAVIQVAFLRGRQTPIIETADASFNTLGVQIRGYHDFGCSRHEFRAGVRSTGA